MQPVKLGGLTLKSEGKKEEVEEIVDAASEGLEVPKPEEGAGESNQGKVENPESEIELPLELRLRLIIADVEALDKTDNTIKAIGKLKGALQLLS